MIFALAGTNPYPFDRLTQYLDRMVVERGWEVVVQTGASAPPSHCQWFAFAPYEETVALMRRSAIVICQAGYGSCLDALILGVPLVVVPRSRDLGECLDDQMELAAFLQKTGRALVATDYSTLMSATQSIIAGHWTNHSTGNSSPGKAIANVIRDFIARERAKK
jgi:UDP-N-acetylglucosamine transferase subunit ALG13